MVRKKQKISRRSFLKGSVITGVTAGITGAIFWKQMTRTSGETAVSVATEVSKGPGIESFVPEISSTENAVSPEPTIPMAGVANGANGFGFKGFVLSDNEWTLDVMSVRALEALLSEAQAAGGGIVNIPEGLLMVTGGAIDFPNLECNIWLRGAGQGKTVIRAQGELVGNILQAQLGCSNIIISDLTVDGGNISGNHLGINLGAGFVNGLIEHVTVYDCGGNGINIRQCTSVTVRHCTSYNHEQGHGIAMGGDEFGGPAAQTTDFSCYNNECYGIPNNGKYGINSHGRNGQIWGNHIHDCARLMKTPDIQNVEIFENSFDLPDGGLFHWRSSDDVGRGARGIIRDNTFIGVPDAEYEVLNVNHSTCIYIFYNNMYPSIGRPVIDLPLAGNAYVSAGSYEDTNKNELFTNPQAVITLSQET